ncbi:RHS repeat-associated core domain-containing protein [Streptomyces coeruleorubidus]|uniref:RHS repeat-associated core domain-containing protein n=1 Tax=Streptomyces coeruleorubidus TaxID=116188 RepID=UPI003807C904
MHTRQLPAGLIHIGAREYDPALGQFLSIDPVLNPSEVQSVNGYGYANNSPATLADPTGLDAIARVGTADITGPVPGSGGAGNGAANDDAGTSTTNNRTPPRLLVQAQSQFPARTASR